MRLSDLRIGAPDLPCEAEGHPEIFGWHLVRAITCPEQQFVSHFACAPHSVSEKGPIPKPTDD